MQVNLNCNCPKTQQSFGMAIHSNEVVNSIIKSRIKTLAELEKLNKVIDKAQKNKYVDVTLMANTDEKTIVANIYSKKSVVDFFKQKKETFFSRVFVGGIVGFIEKCSDIADKAAIKIGKSEEIANSEVFNKLK